MTLPLASTRGADTQPVDFNKLTAEENALKTEIELLEVVTTQRENGDVKIMLHIGNFCNESISFEGELETDGKRPTLEPYKIYINYDNTTRYINRFTYNVPKLLIMLKNFKSGGVFENGIEVTLSKENVAMLKKEHINSFKIAIPCTLLTSGSTKWVYSDLIDMP